MIGLLISYLWFISDHSAASQNYNILWASPLNILLFIDLFASKKKKKVGIRIFEIHIFNVTTDD